MELTEDRLTLTDGERRFILHWGEMSARWGITRVVAQIHALLLLSHQPLHAQLIADALGIARSNISTGLRELQSYGLVSNTHVMGDRRDYFKTVGEAWEMFFVIADKRIERELVPTLALLQELKTSSGKETEFFQKRVNDLVELLAGGTKLYKLLRATPVSVVKRFVRADARLAKFLSSLGTGGGKS